MRSRPLATTAALVPSLAAIALLAAGCGGGSASPGVASLGHSSTTTSGGGGDAPPSGSSASPGGSSGQSVTMKMQNGAKFAACMRKHGVPNFPDPDSQGAIQFGPSSGINPSSPKFQAAQETCRKLLPNGGQPTPQQQAKAQQQALAFSACMRRHGVPNFPDPSFSNGGITLKISGGRGTGLDPNSAKFRAAQQACRGKLPGALGTGPGGK